MSITANKWTTLEPSVIRDAVSGRLGFQEKFGTTYVSGATSALSLKQNPLDGSENQGDATLYIGTTNGGVYMRQYDYQSDTWSDHWTWLSQPSGSTESGYDGAQGIGALAISPDGEFIAVGRGNSSNFNAYTPSGPALQIGKILEDGGVDWLPVVSGMLLSGASQSSNIRDLSWQDDGLYAVAMTGGSAPDLVSQFLRFSVDENGTLIGVNNLATEAGNVITSASPEANAPMFVSLLSGFLNVVDPDTGEITPVQSDSWEQIRQQRVSDGERLARISVVPDPAVDGQYVALMGWFSFSQPGKYITHVDRLTVSAENTIADVSSVDFSGKAGNNQASPVDFFGNYGLLFDPADPTLNTVLVGGNQYSSSHPDGDTPYTSTGGFVRGNFSTQSIEAVFGPYKDNDGALVADSLLTGAPHADSRKAVALQTPQGVEIIQSDDGGVWLLSPSAGNPDIPAWTSLNTAGLNALEVVASGWDARSNSFVSAFQDNSTSLGQLGDAYMNNVSAGDGNLALMDGASVESTQAFSWAYLNSQKYMYQGKVYAFALNELGDVARTEVLTMVTNWQGRSVQPLEGVESRALALANPTVDIDDLSDFASFKGAATVNPYRQGDIVLGGDSGLYETFVPNWSDAVTAQGQGTLELVPVAPFSDSNTVFTAVDLGSAAGYVQTNEQPKPFFWDSLLAVSWDKTTKLSTVWYRDPVILDQAPATLADVDREFLDSIALKPLTTSAYAISDMAHSVNQDGSLNVAYWIESGSTFLPPFANGLPLQPTQDSDGAALVIYRDGDTIRLPYAQTPGLDELVLSTDYYGPTSLAILPGLEGQSDLLVIGGVHGLYASELNDQGTPVRFEPMNMNGLNDGVQLGRAVTGLVYNEQDHILSASMLGGGTLLYSQSGELLPTPSGNDLLKVSDTTVPQTLSETLDKRGNSVDGSFVIELPETAFDDEGVAQVQFVIADADLWRDNLESLSFYLQAAGTGPEFNLLSRSGSTLIETLTFYDFATTRLGFFKTPSTIKELPTITLDYQVNLLDASGAVIQTVDASVNLSPNGSTPGFVSYDTLQAEGSSTFQARYSFGDGVEFQKLPFGFKLGLPADLPEGSEVYAFTVDDPLGTIVLADGTRLSPSDPDYLTVGVPSQKITAETPIVSGVEVSGSGIGINALGDLFFAADASPFLASEGVYYGKTMNSLMPTAFNNGASVPPYLGVAVQYADGSLKATTIDTTVLQGNEINLDATQFDRGVVIDVGNGGIFAAQASAGEVSVAKLGRMDSAAGFVRVDDLFGNIGDHAPGEVGYIEAALERSLLENLDLTLTQGYASTANYEMSGFIAGTYYASYITPGFSDVADALDAVRSGGSESVALFSFDAANATDQGSEVSAAIPFAADMIAFEDMPTVGDRDFNDVVMFYGDFV